MKKPFISIVIPTYNRAEKLFIAVSRILQQDCKDFEVIITDNSSNNKAKYLIGSLKSKNIKYFKNKKNIGLINNLKKGITYARGRYIMLHGDDDLLLWDDTISYIRDILTKQNLGLLRLNFVTRVPGNKIIFECLKFIKRKIAINKGSKLKQIIKFFEDTNIGFMTGVVFKNGFPKIIKIINSEKLPWFNIIYYNVRKYGGIFDSKFFFLTDWTMTGNLGNTYYLKEKKMQTEIYLKNMLKKAKKNEYDYFISNYVESIITIFPAIKYFTNNKNLILTAKRIIQISSKQKFSIRFWIFFIASILMPKFLLHLIRFYNLNHIQKICLVSTPTLNNRIEILGV